MWFLALFVLAQNPAIGKIDSFQPERLPIVIVADLMEMPDDGDSLRAAAAWWNERFGRVAFAVEEFPPADDLREHCYVLRNDDLRVIANVRVAIRGGRITSTAISYSGARWKNTLYYWAPWLWDLVSVTIWAHELAHVLGLDDNTPRGNLMRGSTRMGLTTLQTEWLMIQPMER